MGIFNLGCKTKPGDLVRHKKYEDWTGQTIEVRKGWPDWWDWWSWSEEKWQFWHYYTWIVVKLENDSTFTDLPENWEVIREKALP